MACYKIEYDSKGEAQAAMHKAIDSMRNHKTKKGVKPGAYQCGLCNKWHWGHAPTAKRYYEERKRRTK